MVLPGYQTLPGAKPDFTRLYSVHSQSPSALPDARMKLCMNLHECMQSWPIIIRLYMLPKPM